MAADSKRLKIEPINRDQLLLRPVDVEKLVPEDDSVRAIWALTGQMDLGVFYDAVESYAGEAGREAIDPRLMISIWVYAYSMGVSSAREISRLMEYHPGLQWLSGMREINHHTLSDFRIAHQKALDELFTQVLGVLSHQGLVTMERVMQDGTKIQAQAASHSFHREKHLKEHLRLAQEQVARMGDPRAAAEVSPRLHAARQRAAREKQARLEQAIKELDQVRSTTRKEAEDVRVSTSDPAARVMRQSKGGFAPSYNVQVMTDATAGAIVDIHVIQEGSDGGQAIPGLKRLENRMGRRLKQLVTDSGYVSHETIRQTQEREVDFIAPVGLPKGAWGSWARRGIDPTFGSDAFTYDAQTDTMICPNHQRMSRFRKNGTRSYTAIYYRAEPTACGACPWREKCSPHQAARTVVRSQVHPVIAAWRRRMESPEVKNLYKQRSAVAEFANAWIKDKLKLRQFRLRGRGKTQTEMLWAGLTYNIQLWIRKVWRVPIGT